MKPRIIFSFLFLFLFASLNAQTIFYYDSFKGGTTADGYAPAHDGSGNANLLISIAPGSTIRKAYLLGSRLGLAPNVTVNLAGNNLTFDMSNQATGGFASIYGSPSGVHAIDVTSIINPAVNMYNLSIPGQNGTTDRYQGFYLYVAYENAGLDSVYTAIVLNNQDMSGVSYNYNIVFPDAMNNASDVGVSMFTGYICYNDNSDWSEITVNGTNIGGMGGADPNSGFCGGPVGSYFYQNVTLTGLNGDNANSVVFGDDALFDAQPYLPVPSNSITLDITNNSSNHIYGMIFNWGTSCSNINIGPDQAICPGDSVVLSASAFSYLWQDGSTDSFFVAHNTGTYWLEAVDASGCLSRDTVLITASANPLVNLGPDQSVCPGQSVTFNAGAGFASYLWNTTAVTQSISASTIGTYYVEVTNAGGCIGTDTVSIVSYLAVPSPFLGNDTTLCEGNSATLSTTNPFVNYLWSNGTTNSNLPVQSTGSYWVEVTNAVGCKNRDTIVVQINPAPAFSLGPDIAICHGTTYTITPVSLPANTTYLWNDGSTQSTLLVVDVGTYTLTLTDLNNCTYADSLVAFDNCEYPIYIPNTFTPNLDELNPIFYAYGTGIIAFKMDIYDRWGQLIHTLNSITEGWNGNYVDKPAPQGTYVYKVVYSTNDDIDLSIIGHVNLIR